MSWERNVCPNSPPRLGGVAAPPRKCSRSLLAQTGWYGMARSHLIDTRVALLIQSVRFANIDKVATHSRPLDTGVWDNRRERRSPLLGKGGDAGLSSRWSRTFGGAAGVVRSSYDDLTLKT